MEFTFESQGANTYLVYTLKKDDVIDIMSLGMLTNNKILGLAPTQFTQMDDTKYIKYNVSAHISVKQFFAGPVNKKRILGVFKGIVNAMLSAEDYMIDTHSIIMDMEYIFADVSTCETVLICLPIAEVEQHPVDLGTFFKNIVFSTQFDQTENCDYVAKIINYLNSSPIFSLADFKEILESIDANTQRQPIQQKVQPVATPIPQPQVVSAPKQNPQPIQQKQPAQQTAVIETQQPAVKPVVPAPAAVAPKMPVPNMPKAPAMTVPQKPGKNQPAEKSQETSVPADGEPMSMMYLLQHYNKENAAIYKAQKEAKKGKKTVPPPPKKSGAFTVPGAPNSNMPVPPNAPPMPQSRVVPPTPQAKVPFAVPGQPTPTPTPVSKTVTTPTPVSETPVGVTNEAQVIQPTVAATPVVQTQAPVPQASPMNFGETTVLGGGGFGETTVLNATSAANQARPHLIRAKNNEKINLNKPVFRIGKEKSYVDYFIGDNTAISRSHANFISRDGEYFVTDTNSTNHTYVNGTMIQSNIEVKLSHGDKVRLANEDFEFKLY